MSLRVDVVIPTRGRERSLPRVLAPLLADPALGRVIVVDDSTPGERDERLGRLASDRVELVGTAGVGPAAARQAGLERASADVVLFVDDDVVLDAGVVSGHAAHHGTGERLLVCGYTPVVPAGDGEPTAEAAVYGRTYEDRCAEYERDRRVVLTHLWGGNFSLRRVDALAVGLASPRFAQPYHEDREFGLRCLAAGLDAIFDRALRGAHEYERPWGQVAVESYRRGYSLVLLHDLHADAIGPFDEGEFERGLPRPAAAFVHAATRMPGSRLAKVALVLLRRGGARLGLRRTQIAAVRLLRRVEAARGAQRALARRPASGDR